nr:DUF4926 domain-containing protein [Methylobacterium persicinum]
MAKQHTNQTTTSRRRTREPRRPNAAFQLQDRVRLRAAVKSEDGGIVYAGCVGTIVVRWAHGAAFDVEFTHPAKTFAIIEPNDLELVERARGQVVHPHPNGPK